MDTQNCSHFIPIFPYMTEKGKDVGYLSRSFCNTIMYGKTIEDLIVNSQGIEEDPKMKSIFFNFKYKQNICLYVNPITEIATWIQNWIFLRN